MIETREKKIILVTHVHPDFDAILSVWLLQRQGGYEDSELEFVPVGNQLQPRSGVHVIHVDTGLGEFDNHSEGNQHKSSAELVFESLGKENDVTLKKLVEYSHQVDFALLSEENYTPFGIVSILSGLNQLYPESPKKVVQIGFELLDAIYLKLQETVFVEQELRSSIEFSTIWGRGLAIESDNMAARGVAYKRGFNIFLSKSPTKGFVGFKAQGGSGIDFTSLYFKLREKEPDVDWFLHSSKELLLCGSPKAPDRKLTRLSLKQLVEIAKSVR